MNISVTSVANITGKTSSPGKYLRKVNAMRLRRLTWALVAMLTCMMQKNIVKATSMLINTAMLSISCPSASHAAIIARDCSMA